jgi:hypothetical protein
MKLHEIKNGKMTVSEDHANVDVTAMKKAHCCQ